MPRTCLACRHDARAAIDAALVTAAGSLRDIAGQYGLSKSALARHAADHLPAHLAHAADAAEVTDADRLLSEVERLHRLALVFLARAAKAGDLRTALAGIREARGCLELEARVRGQIDEHPQINVLLAPEWLATRAEVMRALEPYVEARLAVSAALLALEEGGSSNGHRD